MTHLTKIGERLLAGVMFHTEVADLFQFLGLNGFYKWQKHQMCEELEHLYCFKSHVIKYHHMLLNLQNAEQPEKLISSDWYNKSALDATQTDITNTLITTFDKCVSWEKDTKNLLYTELAEIESVQDKKEVKELIEDVEYELAMIESLRQKLQVTGFNSIYIQILQDKCCEMYR